MAIDPIIQKKANDIRTKVYGAEVREDMASGLETMSSQVVDNSEKQRVLEEKQNTVETQFQQVIDETTGKDVISAPEIIAARGNNSNLSQRLLSTDQKLADIPPLAEGMLNLSKYNTLLDKDYMADAKINASQIRPVETLFYLPKNYNLMQGITFANNHFYISTSEPNRIYKVDMSGKLIKQISGLSFGHGNDIAHRIKNGNFYVSNGASSLSHIYEVDAENETPTIVSDWDLEYLGKYCGIAIDNETDTFIVHTRKSLDDGHTFTFFNSNKEKIKEFSIPKIKSGITQGMDTYNGIIYFLTATPNEHPTITAIDYDGFIVSQVVYPVKYLNGTHEGEGVCVAWQGSTPYLAMGYISPNKTKITAIRPPENAVVYNRIAPIGDTKRKDKATSSIPKMLAFSISNNIGTGEWSIYGGNHYFNSDNIISSISYNTSNSFLEIVLNESFLSVGHINISQNFGALDSGLFATGGIYDGLLNTIRIKIVDGKNNFSFVDPTKLQTPVTFNILVYGGFEQVEN